MKSLILLFILMISSFSYAQSFGGSDNDGTFIKFKKREFAVKVLSLRESQVEAIVTRDGVYIRPVDLEDGIEQLDGVKVEYNLIRFDFNKSNINLDRILMNNGKIMKVSGEGGSGGNAGG